MTPEEQIAALQQQVADLQQQLATVPQQIADAVTVATTTLHATIDTRAAYASGLESQLSEAQSRASDVEKQLSATSSQRDGAFAERDAAKAALAAIQPAVGSVVTPIEFTHRIAISFLTIPTLAADKQSKWDRIINVLLPKFSAIHLDDPLLIALVNDALADGLFGPPDSTQAKGTRDAVLHFAP